MKNNSKFIKKLQIGGRASRLARIQTQSAIRELKSRLPEVVLEEIGMSSPGDRDRHKDLRESPGDFFTRDLDKAVLDGRLNLAVHSAKDLPDCIHEGLDWFWLPKSEDPRDVLVSPIGKSVAGLPEKMRIGVSSDRRAEYCKQRFPDAVIKPVRGNVEHRVRQLDQGDFDLIVTAGAALKRLGMENRISEWLELEQLPTPEGQGTLAVVFRAGDDFCLRLRSLFVKAVAFVGAGPGVAENCTVAGVSALRRADICLFDALLDKRLLEYLPERARRIYVGKRAGEAHYSQKEINELIAWYARRGLRVARVKGGDPTIFGRLAEETQALERLKLPYRAVPGVSSLNALGAGSGILLTRRGESSGFSVLTGRKRGGGIGDIEKNTKAELPCVLFMASSVAGKLASDFIEEGYAPETPAALVCEAGGESEKVIRGTLAAIASGVEGIRSPALFVVGSIARYGFSHDHGALRGRRILLTCSETLMNRAVGIVQDLGGCPLRFPLIKLQAVENIEKVLQKAVKYQWLILTSPSAARIFLGGLKQSKIDIRDLPRLVVSGPGTARELHRYGLIADVQPQEEFGAAGIVKGLLARLERGERVLRLRSDAASPALTTALRNKGVSVDEKILYRNAGRKQGELPQFDAAFFASSSAVDVFEEHWGVESLSGKVVAGMGLPTAERLTAKGVEHVLAPAESTIENVLAEIGRKLVVKQLQG